MKRDQIPEISYQVNPSENEPADMYRVLDACVAAGKILLENGAEIFRVEETMKRISSYYGVTNADFYVITNAVFASGDDDKKSKVFAKVKYVPLRGTELRKVILINELSRKIVEGKFTIDEVEKEIDRIKKEKTPGRLLQIIASGVGSMAFCIMFGGTLLDSIAALITGLILYVFMLFVAYPKLSKIMANFLGGTLVTVSCMLLYKLGLGNDLNHMIIGSIIPLIPGVAFTNGVRDIANTDFLSGTVRLLDAIIGFVAIALGVGVVYIIYRHFGGAL